MSTSPGYIDDGDFGLALPNGAPTYDFPFSYRGDFNTFVASQPVRCAVSKYQPPKPMGQHWFPGLGRGYLVDFTTPSMIGQGLLNYTLIYASVPKQGVEYRSVTYSAQTYTIGTGGANDTLSSSTDTYDGTWVYDYSIWKPLPQILYTRLALIPEPETGTFPGRLQINVLGSALGVDAPGRALAQNTTTQIWKGRIFERLSIFINYQQPRVLITV